jgi:hypothetical protein
VSPERHLPHLVIICADSGTAAASPSGGVYTGLDRASKASARIMLRYNFFSSTRVSSRCTRSAEMPCRIRLCSSPAAVESALSPTVAASTAAACGMLGLLHNIKHTVMHKQRKHVCCNLWGAEVSQSMWSASGTPQRCYPLGKPRAATACMYSTEAAHLEKELF